MATIRRRKNGTFEIIIQRKGVLPKPHYATAETEQAARDYAANLERLLDQGIIPVELCGEMTHKPLESVGDWARRYLVTVAIADADKALLNQLLPVMRGWPVNRINRQWADEWINSMKTAEKLAPGTIRHKVGAVARLLDWAVRNEWLQANPLRLLPKRYASYAQADGDKRVDVERDRRLLPGEFERIMAVLAGESGTGSRAIADKDRAAWRLLVVLAVETAMRMREIYTLTLDQIDLDKRTIFLDKTKNGDKRQVPLSSVALAELKPFCCDHRNGLLFPWWYGDAGELGRVTAKLSRKWITIAKLAGCDDLRFHDLRHEAVCRFYQRTTLSDVQIARITGHKDLRMLKRYASLRGSDLAQLLW